MKSLLRRSVLPAPWRGAVAALVVLVLAAGSAWAVIRDDALPDGVALEVDGTRISVRDLERRIGVLEALYGVERPKAAEKMATFRADTAKSMAVGLLMQQAAEERAIVVPAKDVDDTVAALVQQRYPEGGRRAFVAAMGDLGASEQQVRDEIEQQVMVSRLFESVTADVAVDEDDVRAAFRERRAQLGVPARRVVSNIVVRDQGSARAVLRELSSGAPFEQVAARRSLDEATRDGGGNLGAVARDQLERAYGAAAFEASPGVPFGPVRTSSGWNVGVVRRLLAPVPASFEEVESALRQTLVSERSLEVWREWLEDLLADAEVEYAEGYRPADPDSVPDVGGSTGQP